MRERTDQNARKKDQTALNKTKRQKSTHWQCWGADWRDWGEETGADRGEDQGNGKIIIILLTPT